VTGQLAVRHDGRTLHAGPGTRVQVAPGVAHDFWNASGEEARVLVEVRPGRRLEQLIRQLFLSAQEGRTDARAGHGRCRPPCWPRSSPTPSGSPAHHGYHGDPTIGELNPLPPEIVALIPTLAAAEANERQP
jgi:hypothetical protein